MHKSVTIKNTPGITIVHHALVKSACSAKESMLPQEITPTGSPIPIKLKVASAIIALRIFITTINMMEEIKLGAR